MAKIKFGFPGKKYTAKEGYKDGEYKMRIDSAFKLLKARNGWQYSKTMEYSGRDGAVRTTDSPRRHGDRKLETLTTEDIRRIEEHATNYDYSVTVIPAENKIEIWDPALDTWQFVHPNLKAKRA